MVFVTAFTWAVATFGIGAVINTALTVASIAYQRAQVRKMEAKMRAAAEARKGFETTKRGEVINLPVAYGYNKLGSVVTDQKVSNSVNWVAPSNYNDTTALPSATTFSYDATNYNIEITSWGKGLVGSGEDENLINIVKTRTRVIWNGVEVYNVETSPSATDPADIAALSNTLALYLKDFTDELGTTESGAYAYTPGTQKAISKVTEIPSTLYKWTQKYELRRTPTSDMNYFGTLRSYAGSKKEILITQNAICFGGIDRVVDIDIDEVSSSNAKFKNSFFAGIYNNGGVADNTASNNGFPSTNYFTNTAYATSIFKLNRDDPQYNGIPAQSFYIKGQRIYDINFDGTDYTLSAVKIFSNNPALILLDYLTSTSYGRGLDIADIDLKSFYNAKTVCDTAVGTGSFGGKVYGGSTSSVVRLYEFNDIIDTAGEVRDNVDKILSSMGDAFLIWSGGKYKLNLSYPTEDPSVANGYVHADHVFTDADIIRSDISVEWPKAEDKFNQVTIKFYNAIKNFKSDSVTWPKENSTAHNQYLLEDNNQPLKTDISVPGIVDPYHAMAKAEEMVRKSRTAHYISVKLQRKAVTLEPGDYFLLKSEMASISNASTADNYEIYKVLSIEYDSELNCKIKAVSFDYRNLAWNIDDNVPYPVTVKQAFVIEPPTNVIFTEAVDGILGVQSGQVTWDASTSSEVDKYIVEVTNDSGVTWAVLGETYGNTFDITGLASGSYSFAVKAVTNLNRMSSRAIAEDLLGNTVISLQRKTTDQVAVIYADSADETTNNQSYDLTGKDYVGYYVYSSNLPTLPIRSNITFSKFVGDSGIDGLSSAQLSIFKRYAPGWEVASMEYSQSSDYLLNSNAKGLYIRDDGLKLYYADDGAFYNIIKECDLSVAWDLSTLTEVQAYSVGSFAISPTGVTFKPDGTVMYVIDNGVDKVYQIPLAVAWDVSTAGVETSVNISAETLPNSVVFKDDGTEFFVVGSSSDTIRGYSMTTAWDVTTATVNSQSLYVGGVATIPTGLFFGKNGTRLYVMDNGLNRVVQYNLSTAWDLSTKSYAGNLPIFDDTSEGGPSDIFLSPDGESLFVIGYGSDKIHKFVDNNLVATPTGGSYNFDTKVLVPPSQGWYAIPPEGPEPLYISSTIASISGISGVDNSLEWSEPSLILENGLQGDTGETGPRGAGWWRYDTGSDDLSSLSSNDVMTYWYTLQTLNIEPTKDDRLILATTHESGTKAFIYDEYWIPQAEFIDGNLLVNGTVTSNAIATGAITSEKITVGELSAINANLGDVTINNTLRLEEGSAGFIGGRTSSSNYDEEGFFMARTLKSDGTAGFEVSHTSNTIDPITGLTTSISGIIHTDGSPMRVFNPEFYLGGTNIVGYRVGTSETRNIGPVSELFLTIVGGGGQGGAADPGSSGNGGSGGDTIVKVWADLPSGPELIQKFRAEGGAGGLNSDYALGGKGGNGYPTAFGKGGLGGEFNSVGGAAPTSSYGAGGGGHGAITSYFYSGWGGKAGETIEAVVNTSDYEGVDILLEISIGSGGSDPGYQYDYLGGHGADGGISYLAITGDVTKLTLDEIYKSRKFIPQTTQSGSYSSPQTTNIVSFGTVTLPAGWYRTSLTITLEVDANGDDVGYDGHYKFRQSKSGVAYLDFEESDYSVGPSGFTATYTLDDQLLYFSGNDSFEIVEDAIANGSTVGVHTWSISLQADGPFTNTTYIT